MKSAIPSMPFAAATAPDKGEFAGKVRYVVTREKSKACQLCHISPERPFSPPSNFRDKWEKWHWDWKQANLRPSNLTMRLTSAGWLQTSVHIKPDPILAKGGIREKITELSYKSLERLRYLAAHTPVEFRSMVTLTYPASYPMDSARIKRDLDAFLKALKRRSHSGMEYLWILEFQKRGAPHFHIWLSHDLGENLVELRRPAPKKPAKVSPRHQEWCLETWYRIVDSGDEKHRRAGACWEAVRDANGARKYLVKECSKKWQKALPDGWEGSGRWWGTSRGVKKNIPFPITLTAQEVEKMLAILPPECINKHTGRPFNNVWMPPRL